MAYRHGNTLAAQRQFQAAAANYDNASPAEDDREWENADHAVRSDYAAMLSCAVEAAGFSAVSDCNHALLALRDADQALRRLASGQALNEIQMHAIRTLSLRAAKVHDAVEREIAAEVARRLGRDAA